MGTFQIISIILVCIGLGYLLGYFLSGRKIKVNKKTGHKNLEHNPFDISPEEETKRSKIEGIASEVLAKSVRKQESFIKTMKETSIPDNIATFSIVAEILKKVQILYFDELIDLISDYSTLSSNIKINLQRRKSLFIKEDEILYAINNAGLEYIFPLIKDENFEDGNSLTVFLKVEEEFSTDHYLVKYICEGDGKKYWHKPEAEKLVILTLAELVDGPKSNVGAAEKALMKAFPEEFKIIEDLKKNSKVFLSSLEKYDRKKLVSVFKIVDPEEEFRCLLFLETKPELFKLWLENTPIISDKFLFNYLAWNNVLPERFKDDERYVQAEESLKEYEFSDVDLNRIKNQETEKSLIEYIQKYSEEDDFVENYVDDKKFIPSAFWFIFERGEWRNLKEAQEKLDEYSHDSPYLHLGYILEGYPLTEDVFDRLCKNEVIEALQLYYKTHHEKHLNRF